MVGEVIYFHRKKSSMTQEELARGICSVPYLSKIENNKIEPNPETVQLLFEKLGVSIDWDQNKKDGVYDLIQSWYKSMKQRRSDDSNSLREEIITSIGNQDNPRLLKRFLLFDFNYFLTENNLKEAHEKCTELSNHLKYFSTEENYYYYHFLGLYEYLRDHLIDSLEFYKKSEGYAKLLSEIEPELYYQLALVHSRLNHISFAIHYSKLALDLFHQEANYHKSIDCMIILAINHIRLEDYDQAEKFLENALSNSNRDEPEYLKGIIYHNLGYLYYCKHEPVKAIYFYLLALQEKNEKHDPLSRANTIYYLTLAYLSSNQKEDANFWIQEGISLTSALEKKSMYYKFRFLAGKQLAEIHEEFIHFLQTEVVSYFNKKQEYETLAEVAEFLAKYYSRKSYYKEANKYLHIAVDCLKKMRY